MTDVLIKRELLARVHEYLIHKGVPASASLRSDVRAAIAAARQEGGKV